MSVVAIDTTRPSGLRAQSLGVTRVWDSGAAVAAGVPFEAVHLGGWGVTNPASQYGYPTTRDWSTLDRAVARVSPSARLVLVAYDMATCYGHAGDPAADWHEYAQLVAEAVARYDASVVSFWNEAKGAWTDTLKRSAGAMVDMARATNIVRAKLLPWLTQTRYQRPDNEFWCGYINLGRYSEAQGRGDPLNPASCGGYDVEAWDNYLDGLDFTPDAYTLDYSLSQYGVTETPEVIGAKVVRFAAIQREFLASVAHPAAPVVWAEYYAQVNLPQSATILSAEQHAAIDLASLIHQAGAHASFKWQPQGDANSRLEGWWPYESLIQGAQEYTPAGANAMRYQAAFPAGTPLVTTMSDMPTLSVAASKKHIVIVNTSGAAASVTVEVTRPLGASAITRARSVSVPAWSAWWGTP